MARRSANSAEGTGCDMTGGTVPEFAWAKQRKPRTISGTTAGLLSDNSRTATMSPLWETECSWRPLRLFPGFLCTQVATSHVSSVSLPISLSFLLLPLWSIGPLPTQTQNKCRQIFMPWVGLEPTIPELERAKTVHALDGAATVIGILPIRFQYYIRFSVCRVLNKVYFKNYCSSYFLLLCLPGLPFDPEDGGSAVLRNFGRPRLLPDYNAAHSRS
jgi:hypothetical protein